MSLTLDTQMAPQSPNVAVVPTAKSPHGVPVHSPIPRNPPPLKRQYQCIATKSNGVPCSRKCITNGDMCGIHIRSHGIKLKRAIEKELEVKNVSQHTMTSSKSKTNLIEFHYSGRVSPSGRDTPSHDTAIQTPNLVEMQLHVRRINGIQYYVSNSNQVYNTFDIFTKSINPRIIGEMVGGEGGVDDRVLVWA